jgi:hypothetical protein
MATGGYRLDRVSRPSHATVIAYLALFVALAGGAYAASLAKNSVKAKQIAKNAVRAAEIKADAVTESEMAADAVTGSEIKSDAVTESEIAPDAVGGSEIAADSVVGADVKDDSLSGADIDESTLSGIPVSPQVLRFGGAIPSGTTIMGGWGLDDNSNGVNARGYDAVNFPLPAPLPLSDAKVNAAASTSGAADDDSSCTGTSTNPTAPPDQVCIYVDSGVVSANSVYGFALAYSSGTPAPIKTMGFIVYTDDASTDMVTGTWAYTAP